MKINFIIIGLVAAAAALGGTPAYAGNGISGWVTTVNKKLDRAIVFPGDGRHGVAHAVIQRTPEGRAKLVSVRSESRAVARAARITVSRLRGLPPMPSGYEGSVIALQMLIGDPDDAYSFYRNRDRMLASADTRNRQLAARLEGAQLAMNAAR